MPTISMTQLAAAAAPAGNTNASASNGGSSTPYLNVAVRPMSYDIPNRITTGINISTGETVSIRLDDANKKESRDDVSVWAANRYKDSRGIRSLANAKAVVAGDEGGVLIFEGVHPVKDGGPLEARWATTASHAEGVAEVFTAFARPATKFGSRTEMDPKFPIELIRPLSAKPIASMQELKESIKEILARPFVNAIVRVFDADEKVSVATIWKGKDQTVDQAVDRFVSNDRLGSLMSDDVCEGAVVEIFALERIYPGRDYGKVLGDESKTDSMIFQRDWSLGDGQGTGFANTIVAVRQYEDPQTGVKGGYQLTKIRPESTRSLLYRGLEDIPTPNISPKSAPVAGKSAQSQPESAAPAASIPSAGEGPALTDDAADALSKKLADASRNFAR